MDLMTWISPEKFAGVLARFGSAVVHRKGPFCSFENLSERVALLDSSRETMRHGLLICPVWSSDGFPIAFQNYLKLTYFINLFFFIPFIYVLPCVRFLALDDFDIF